MSSRGNQDEAAPPPRRKRRSKRSATKSLEADRARRDDDDAAEPAQVGPIETDPLALRVRRHTVAAAAAAVAGLALVGTGQSTSGMVVTLAALVGLLVSIHRLGRLGPSPRSF